MPNDRDPRVIRTRQMLRDALVAVILDKGYEAATIQDITDRAGLRRATFYLHYRDKEELLVTMLRTAFDGLVTEMEALPYQILTPEAERAIYLLALRHAQDNAALYNSILNGNGSTVIMRYVRDYLSETVCKKFLSAVSPGDFTIPLELVAHYLAVLTLNLVLWWLEKDMPYPPDVMADMCGRLTLNGAVSAFAPDATLPNLDELMPTSPQQTR